MCEDEVEADIYPLQYEENEYDNGSRDDNDVWSHSTQSTLIDEVDSEGNIGAVDQYLQTESQAEQSNGSFRLMSQRSKLPSLQTLGADCIRIIMQLVFDGIVGDAKLSDELEKCLGSRAMVRLALANPELLVENFDLELAFSQFLVVTAKYMVASHLWAFICGSALVYQTLHKVNISSFRDIVAQEALSLFNTLCAHEHELRVHSLCSQLIFAWLRSPELKSNQFAFTQSYCQYMISLCELLISLFPFLSLLGDIRCPHLEPILQPKYVKKHNDTEVAEYKIAPGVKDFTYLNQAAREAGERAERERDWLNQIGEKHKCSESLRCFLSTQGIELMLQGITNKPRRNKKRLEMMDDQPGYVYPEPRRQSVGPKQNNQHPFVPIDVPAAVNIPIDQEFMHFLCKFRYSFMKAVPTFPEYQWFNTMDLRWTLELQYGLPLSLGKLDKQYVEPILDKLIRIHERAKRGEQIFNAFVDKYFSRDRFRAMSPLVLLPKLTTDKGTRMYDHQTLEFCKRICPRTPMTVLNEAFDALEVIESRSDRRCMIGKYVFDSVLGKTGFISGKR